LSSDEDRVNNLVAEARMLENALNELAARQNFLERILMESRTSVDTIKGLDSTASEEMLIPVGGGVLLRSVPPKLDKILVNIGANVMVEKTKEETIKIMEQRAQQLEEDLIAMVNQRNQIADRLDKDRRALQTLLNRQCQ
jgi:prefoldin alpha subunit